MTGGAPRGGSKSQVFPGFVCPDKLSAGVLKPHSKPCDLVVSHQWVLVDVSLCTGAGACSVIEIKAENIDTPSRFMLSFF